MSPTRLTGVRPLLPVALHQDARNIGPWVVLISALSASSILAYSLVFTDAAERSSLASSIAANPALALIFGPARDVSTAEGFNTWRAGMLGAFFAALMAILIVVRNSRAQEDSGQAELLASSVMSRPTRLGVAVAMAIIASAALGLMSWLVTMLFGGNAADSLALSATFSASALLFAGVAAVAAQLGSDARSASTLAIGVLGALFVVRGYIDAVQAPEWTTWATPFGWLEHVAPAAENNPWPLLLPLAAAAALLAVAFWLQSRRDFGRGMISPRRGPARGGWESSLWGVVVRLNAGTVATWVLAFFVLGFVLGFLTTAIGDVLLSNPAVAPILAGGAVTQAALTAQFLTTILSLAGIIAAITGIQVAMRIPAEEANDRVEPLLAGSVPRRSYFAANTVLALAASALALLIAGAVIATVAAGETGLSWSQVFGQSAATVPATWVLVAWSLALVGAAPRARVLGWLGLVAVFALTILGPLFRLWDWLLGISPFWHVPTVSASAPDWSGLAGLALIIAALLAGAFVGFRRRDIAATG
jgi:ABC-2 type transport system permease protein